MSKCYYILTQNQQDSNPPPWVMGVVKLARPHTRPHTGARASIRASLCFDLYSWFILSIRRRKKCSFQSLIRCG